MFPEMLTKKMREFFASEFGGVDPHPFIHGKPDSHGGSVILSRIREVTVIGKKISVPGFACLEGVPSPVLVVRDRDSHGSLLPKL